MYQFPWKPEKVNHMICYHSGIMCVAIKLLSLLLLFKALEDASPHLMPNQREWKDRDDNQRVGIRPTCPKIELFQKTPLNSMCIMREKD